MNGITLLSFTMSSGAEVLYRVFGGYKEPGRPQKRLRVALVNNIQGNPRRFHGKIVACEDGGVKAQDCMELVDKH